MVEIMKKDVAAVMTHISTEAESALLQESRQSTYSLKGELKNSSNGLSNFTSTVNDKEQPVVSAAVTEKEGMKWDTSYYDNWKMKFQSGSGLGSAEMSMKGDFLLPTLGSFATGFQLPLNGSYKSSILNPDGSVNRNLAGMCSFKTKTNEAVCQTTATDANGKILFLLDESTRDNRRENSINYKATMTNIGGAELGTITIDMKEGTDASTYIVEAGVKPKL